MSIFRNQIIRIFALGVILVILPFVWVTYNLSTPKFKVGECVQVQSKRESWESPAPILKIREIGEEAYRAVFWSEKRKIFMESDYTLYFVLAKHEKVIPCPE